MKIPSQNRNKGIISHIFFSCTTHLGAENSAGFLQLLLCPHSVACSRHTTPAHQGTRTWADWASHASRQLAVIYVQVFGPICLMQAACLGLSDELWCHFSRAGQHLLHCLTRVSGWGVRTGSRTDIHQSSTLNLHLQGILCCSPLQPWRSTSGKRNSC